MLLAHVAGEIEIGEFAFERDRARDFADDLDRDAAYAERRFTGQLILASVRSSFTEGLADRTPSSDLNRRIGSAVLGAFRDELADSTGMLKSLWLERIQRTANDAEGLIEELLKLDRAR
jgi:hypothetical protein